MIERDGGDIGKPDLGVVASRKDQVQYFLFTVETPDCAYQVALSPVVEITRGGVPVALTDGIANVGQSDTSLRQFCGVDVNLQLPFGTSVEFHLKRR